MTKASIGWGVASHDECVTQKKHDSSVRALAHIKNPAKGKHLSSSSISISRAFPLPFLFLRQLEKGLFSCTDELYQTLGVLELRGWLLRWVKMQRKQENVGGGGGGDSN